MRFATSIVVICFLGACSDLPGIELGSCGNGVIDPGEDCDGASGFGGDTACADSSDENNACFLVCPSGEDSQCPDGWRCGVDGRCRQPLGLFEVAPGGPWDFPVEDFAVTDVDGDGIADLIGNTATTITVRFGSADATFPDELDVFTRQPQGPISYDDLSGDGLADVIVPLSDGLSVLLGTPERQLEPVAYSAANLGTQPVRVINLPVDDPFSAAPLVIVDRDGDTTLMFFADKNESPIELPLGYTVLDIAGRIRQAALRRDSGEFPTGVFTAALAFTDEDEVFLVEGVGTWDVDLMPEVVDQDDGVVGIQGVKLPAGAFVGPRGAWFADVDGVNGMDLVIDVVRPGAPLPENRRWTAIAFKTDANSATFADAVYLSTEEKIGGEPVRQVLLAADFSGDGIADFVTPYAVFTTCSLSQTCDAPAQGAVPPQVNFAGVAPVASQWEEAKAGDFNGDGVLDFVASITNAEGLFIYVNAAGIGIFNPFVVNTDGSPRDLRVADFDGDLVQDIAYVEDRNETSRLFVVFGSRSGGFGEPVDMGAFGSLEGLEQMFFFTEGQVDLIADLVIVAEEDGSRDLIILQGSSTRRMVAPYRISRRVVARAAVGQFDGVDGSDVLAVTFPSGDLGGVPLSGQGTPELLFLSGIGGGHFADAATQALVIDKEDGFNAVCSVWAVGDIAAGEIVADELVGIDGGRVCSNSTDPSPPALIVYESTPSGEQLITPEIGPLPSDNLSSVDRLELFDADNDGDLDALATFAGQGSGLHGLGDPESAGVSVYWNSGGDLVQSSSPVNDLPDVRGAASILIDGDSMPELVILTGNGLFRATIDPADKQYGQPEKIFDFSFWRGLRVGDVNGDGLVDLVLLSVDQVEVYLARAAPPRGDQGDLQPPSEAGP